MDNDFYKKMIDNSSIGYAYHKIICDMEGKPCDYEFIEVNSAFEALTGLKSSRIIGKKVTDVLPKIKEDEFDWIRFYGTIALCGGEEELEQYSKTLKRWYRVRIYSPEKYYFITSFIDITKAKDQLIKMEKIVEISEEFLQMNKDEIDYQKISDDFLKICGAKYAAFNLFDEDGKAFTTMALSGNVGKIKKVAEKIGYQFVGKKWQHDPVRTGKIEETMISHFSSLSEFAGHALPLPLLAWIENTFKIGEVVIIKILKNDIMMGDFTLILGKGEKFEKEILAELYTRQLGILISRKRAEESLRSNQRKLSDIIDFLPDATLGIDQNKNIIIWNKAIERMTGIPASEMMGKGDYTYTIPFYGDTRPQLMDLVFHNKDEIADQYTNIIREEETIMAEVFVPALYNNKGAWIFVKASPLHDKEGSIIGVIESIRDITEKKNAEEALRESEERYKFLFKYSGVAIGYYKPDGTVIFFNEKAAENMGGRPEDYAGKSIYELFPHAEADFYMGRISKAISGDRQQEYEDYIALAPGTKWYFTTFNRVKDMNGNVVGVQIISQDISARKKAENELRETKDYLEKLISYANAPIIVWNTQFQITRFNGAFEKITGRKEEEVLGKTIEILFPIDQASNTMQLIENAQKGKRWETVEIDIIHLDGSIRTLLWNSATIYDPNDTMPISTIAQGQDISDRKSFERKILYLSFHDQLTGLYNRRFYEEELKRLDTSRNLPMTIAMGDVNGLKLINDSFGHSVGDSLLKKVAEVMRKGCRADDIIARLGGDEFVIILPQTDAAEAEKIIKRIKDLSSKEKEGSVELSISFGYETKTKEEENIQEVLKRTEDHMYRHKLYESTGIRAKTIELIMNTLYEKNNREMLHSKRVSSICEALASQLNFEKDDINQIRIAGLMHDIGKIGIDEKILNKPGRLDPDEWKEIQRHSEIGYRILNSVNEFSELSDYVLEHHEKWDGTGYPRGLKGEDVSLQARIIAIADAYDAMTTERPYGKVLSEEEAIEEMKRFSGSQFDADIAKVFIDKVLIKK